MTSECIDRANQGDLPAQALAPALRCPCPLPCPLRTVLLRVSLPGQRLTDNGEVHNAVVLRGAQA